MQTTAFRDRPYHAFLSHAHVDKGVVDRIHDLLTRCAGLSVWYDSKALPAAKNLATELPDCIAQCRSMILVLSKAAVESGWVKEEYSYAVLQRTRNPRFRIIPIRLDDCAVPAFLETTKWLEVPGGCLGSPGFVDLLEAFYHSEVSLDSPEIRDVYVSRSWRDSEASLPDDVCRALAGSSFRLVGDCDDQGEGDPVERVSAIMASCGAFVAIAPDRGSGSTSQFILDEIRIAGDKGLPRLVVAEPSVHSVDAQSCTVVRMSPDARPSEVAGFRKALEELGENWRGPEVPHYVFFATDLDTSRQGRNLAVKRLAQSVTAMPCILGEDIRSEHVQKHIIERITGAFVMLADVSEDNLNTCIEAGIARGAGTRLHLIAKGPRRRPPFMFRDTQVFFYDDDVELPGVVHRVLRPYRRRVLNHELRG